MGCDSFCCRLLVRLEPDEMDYTVEGVPKGFVDKGEDGNCIHFDNDTNLCRIWEKRPKICRAYDCNSDFMLQVVLREGFTNIADVARKATNAYIPKESYILIPWRKE